MRPLTPACTIWDSAGKRSGRSPASPASAAARRSVQLALPVGGDTPGWARSGLVERVVLRRRQLGAFVVLVGGVVPEPVLPRLEAAHDGVVRTGVLAGVLAGRAVATADMAACRAAAEVEPPPVRREALDAPGPAGFYLWVDPIVGHDRRLPGQRIAALGQDPTRTGEVARVPVRVVLQVVLVLGLRLPEGSRGHDLGHHLAGPEAGGLHVGNGVLGHQLLLVTGVEDRRAVAQPHVVALTVLRRGVVDLEEELEDVPVGRHTRIEGDLDRLGMGPVVAVGGVRHVAPGVPDPGREHARALADEVLHAPETSTGQYCLLCRGAHEATSSLVAPPSKSFVYSP